MVSEKARTFIVRALLSVLKVSYDLADGKLGLALFISLASITKDSSKIIKDEYLPNMPNHSTFSQGAALISICIKILIPVSFWPHHTKSNFLLLTSFHLQSIYILHPPF